jgi:hypothetical protein
MLKLRHEQMAALVRYRERQFEDWMLGHILEHFSEQFATIGEGGVRQLIQDGVKKAAANGFTSERNVCKFIDLMVVFGPDFDKHDWADKILGQNEPSDADSRIEHLCNEAMNRLP